MESGFRPAERTAQQTSVPSSYSNEGKQQQLATNLSEGTVLNRIRVGRSGDDDAGGVTQLKRQTGAQTTAHKIFSRLHFGLADNEIIEKVEIRWSSGLILVSHFFSSQPEVINIVEGGIQGTDANEC